MSSSSFFSLPAENYKSNVDRGRINQNAQLILTHLSKAKKSLPGNVFISNGGQSVSFYTVVTRGLYRKNLKADGTGNILNFMQTDNRFDVLNRLPNFNQVNTNQDHLAIGQTFSRLNGTSTEFSIAFNSVSFPTEPVNQRFFIVDQWFKFSCDLPNKKLSVSSRLVSSGVTITSVISDNLKSCHFSYNTTEGINGLLKISIGLEDISSSASIAIVRDYAIIE